MSDTIFQGLFDSSNATVISVSSFLLCIGASLLIGLLLAVSYMYRSRYTKSFVATLAILPAIICVIIMMVNGNVGAGVAVAGAFSLVRFRSVPGSAREIGAVFLAMATGLLSGMGYIGYAFLFALILCGVNILYTILHFGSNNHSDSDKTLHITIPENLDYNGIFDELFAEYTTNAHLVQAHTSNMGSLYKLTYDVTLKDSTKQKEFIDKLRCRNGNLEIALSTQVTPNCEL